MTSRLAKWIYPVDLRVGRHKATRWSNPMTISNQQERKKLARAQAHYAKSISDVTLEKNIAIALTGCTSRAYKATMPVPVRSTEQPSADNICLPEVAKFAAGFRKSESLTAR